MVDFDHLVPWCSRVMDSGCSPDPDCRWPGCCIPMVSVTVSLLPLLVTPDGLFIYQDTLVIRRPVGQTSQGASLFVLKAELVAEDVFVAMSPDKWSRQYFHKWVMHDSFKELCQVWAFSFMVDSARCNRWSLLWEDVTLYLKALGF